MITPPNWPEITSEAIRYLQDLLCLDTTNPPGNELPAAEYLAGVLSAEGYEPIVLEAAPQRGNLVTRFRGDGSLPPLLLYTHTDVVPAEPAHWTHPPFAGEIADGFVWGRGALDMKSVAVMQLMTMLLLKRHNVALHRDVIFAATADEEIDSDVGADWLVTQHPDLVRAEYGLSEMGGYTLYLEGKKFYPVMTAEKGTCWLKVCARGTPGHGSVPHADHAVLHLVHAIDRVMSHPLPLHFTATASTYVQRLARSVGGTTGLLLSAALNPLLHDAALKAIPDRALADALHAILHNTVSPNQLRAGYKANVIPSEAEAILDGRMLPGFDVESFLAEVRPRLGEGIEITIEHSSPPLEVSSDTPLFRLIEQQIARADPGAIAVPYMMAGATDAKLFAKLGTQCYGYAPLKLQPDTPFDGLVHGHDERVSVDAFAFGVKLLYETVCDFCGQN
ncbi:MAG: M20/M25/M40 family metallo-hydrolase [Chloroflexi bacterium]|nr:M20/M25/M40 family metallo-hydrolase [Chloroflexota bacterium]